MVEKPETSIWGLVLNIMGALILLFGFTTALMMMIPESLSLLIVIAGEIGVATCTFPIVSLLGRLRGKTSNDEIFPPVATWATTLIVILVSSTLIMTSGGGVGVIPETAWPLLLGGVMLTFAVMIIFPRVATWATTLIVILASFLLVMKSAWPLLLGGVILILAVIKLVEMFLPKIPTWATTIVGILISCTLFMMSGGGGDVEVIPESAWPLLLGTVTMLGAALCAAICIMVAVKSGSAAMLEKPELSIWSLLFVALGEGLAIYGLIVALLIVMR